jgi:hypothetical protein
MAILRHGDIAILKYCLQNAQFFPPGPVQQGGEGLGQPGLQVREPLLTISLKNIREGGRVGGWDFQNGKVSRSSLVLNFFNKKSVLFKLILYILFVR